MLNLVKRVEKQHQDSRSAELEYWLGIVWRNYTAWFVRGDERYAYLEKAVTHLENAISLERSVSDSNWLTYASELGTLLVDEAPIRNLERGISILEGVFNATKSYEPLLCSYAEALYKVKEFDKAAEVGRELHMRAKRSKEWGNMLPSAPMNTVAKAYRAQVKAFRKKGRLNQALASSEKLIKTGLATENDQRIHGKITKELA